jgi:hypothetical protein
MQVLQAFLPPVGRILHEPCETGQDKIPFEPLSFLPKGMPLAQTNSIRKNFMVVVLATTFAALLMHGH